MSEKISKVIEYLYTHMNIFYIFFFHSFIINQYILNIPINFFISFIYTLISITLDKK